MPPGRQSSEESARLWRVSGMTLELGGSIVGLALLGWVIDRWQGTQPWGATIGAVLGLAVGGTQFVRRAMSLSREEQERMRRSREARSAPAPSPVERPDLGAFPKVPDYETYLEEERRRDPEGQ